LIAVDSSTPENGCLEVVEGSHKMDIPISESNTISPEWVERQTWRPVPMKAGEILIFGTSLAHRSEANKSQQARRAVYATYNPAGDGDLHDAYYKKRAEK
jgi:ectoine hydroxylase-related dioxygenase (phytanoyl-CoA dioxygenase family)